MKNEIVSYVISLSMDNEDFWQLSTFFKHQDLMELAGFFFEDYRSQYETLMKDQYSFKLSKEQVDIEAVAFISWCALHAMSELKGVNPFMKRK